jgi:hypothetical protein
MQEQSISESVYLGNRQEIDPPCHCRCTNTMYEEINIPE